MLYFWNPDDYLIPNMMINTSPWSSCSRQSPWLPCSSHTISSMSLCIISSVRAFKIFSPIIISIIPSLQRSAHVHFYNHYWLFWSKEDPMSWRSRVLRQFFRRWKHTSLDYRGLVRKCNIISYFSLCKIENALLFTIKVWICPWPQILQSKNNL